MWRRAWIGGNPGRPIAHGLNRLGRFAPDPAIPYLALEKADWQNHLLTAVAGAQAVYALAAALTQTQYLAGAGDAVPAYIGFGPISQTQVLSPQACALPSYAYAGLVSAAAFLFPFPNMPGVLVLTPAWGVAVLTPHYTITLGD
jgi:hypothetical protein